MHSVNTPEYISFNASLLGTTATTPIIASRYDQKGVEYKFGNQDLPSVLNAETTNQASQKKFWKLPKEGFRFKNNCV